MTTCSVPGCSRNVGACGMCWAHWNRTRRGRPLDGPIQEKRRPVVPAGDLCSVEGCGRPWLSMGLCTAHYRRSRRYGDDHVAIEPALAQQGGRCAVCGSTDPGRKTGGWATDHDHRTGAVRGILCNGCNTGLGAFGDSIERLQMAIRYLRQRGHGQQSIVRRPARDSAGKPTHRD
jgi:hypothetical protein